MTADKLLKLREWFTLDEAARELSKILDEKVSASDVLRLALEGHLRLSVNLPAGAAAMCFANSVEQTPTLRRQIDGLWELPMVGAGRRQVEHEFNYLRGLPFISMERSVGAIAERAGERCQLPPDPGATGFSPRAASALPQGSMIVVRKGALDAFAAQFPKAVPEPRPGFVDKPVGERERTTLLVIIAALAKAADIDLSRPSKASGQIQSLANEHFQLRISPRTVEEKLKLIPDALERRGKLSSE